MPIVSSAAVCTAIDHPNAAESAASLANTSAANAAVTWRRQLAGFSSAVRLLSVDEPTNKN
eukprot:4763357-Pyramimonas_sp.AAC.1